MVKRLLAVGTGAAMLGATAMGALAAADLKDYPTMFVTDGTFNGAFVVGEKAAAVDNLAMTDIAASMKYKKVTGTAATKVEGDAWLVGTSSKKLEIVNSNATASSLAGETIRDINTFIGDDEMQALKDGKWNTNEKSYDYQQFLFFDAEPVIPSTSRIVKYVEDSDTDITADHLFIQNARQIARYKLEFSTVAQSDVTDSGGTADTSGTYLDDFENTQLTLLGNQYTVVLARRPGTPVDDSIKLTLMAGAARDTMLEGETKSYKVKDKDYDVSLSFIDTDECKFTVNGEGTNKLKVGETYILADKSEVGVSEVLYQDYAGGIHSCTFFVGAEKLELRDDEVQDATDSAGTTIAPSTHRMRVGSTDVDGANVIIIGTDNNATFTISTIELNMTAEDDYFVASGKKLSETIKAAGENEDALFAGALDMEYKGLSEEKTTDFKIKTNSVRRYQLRLLDGDGKSVDVPIAYAASNGNVTLGEEAYSGGRTSQKRMRLTEGEKIAKDDFFIVTGGTASDGSAKSYALQYKGADRQTKSSPKIKFKNLGSSEALEYSVTSLTTTGTTATLKLGGYSFVVDNRSAQGTDDFDVAVDFGGDGTVGHGASLTPAVAFVDNLGSQWAFTLTTGALNDSLTVSAVNGSIINASGTPLDGTVTTGVSGNSTNPNSITLTMSIPNADDYDNVVPNTLIWNITSSSDPEVRGAISGGLSLLTPEGKTNIAYGYTSLGTFLTHDTPSGDPQELTLKTPEKQRFPQIYITSGATTSSTEAAGELTAVAVVDATKLDSEVASVTAQNLVVVGGPCVNTVAAELLGSPADCTTGFTPGKARVKLFEHANGKVAMLVAGYSGADTRLAGKVVAHRASEFSGTEVEVEGTTYSDATISTPKAS